MEQFAKSPVLDELRSNNRSMRRHSIFLLVLVLVIAVVIGIQVAMYYLS